MNPAQFGENWFISGVNTFSYYTDNDKSGVTTTKILFAW